MVHVFLDPDGTVPLGLLLIVQAPTGVTYENQCGGYATETRCAEGFLVPVGGEADADVIFDWFWRTFNGHCYSGVRWESQAVAQLEELVAGIRCWVRTQEGGDDRQCLKLDLARMSECVEAWIPVISPFGQAVLAMRNSD